MGDVFLLGAGFSKAISHKMPVLRELSDQVRDSALAEGPSHSVLSSNLEIWLSYLFQSHPWLQEQDNLRNRALALDISQRVGETLSSQERLVIENECPQWLQSLVLHWHQNQSNVITLNYDAIVERAAAEHIPPPNDEQISSQDLYPIPLTFSTSRNASVWGKEDVSTFKLYKLHGSVNWYYSGASQSTGEVIYFSEIYGWNSALEREDASRLAINDKVPLIVPPTTDKSSFFEHETLKYMWAQASQSIALSERLYAIGYSLPTTDLTIQQFLLEGGGLGAPKKQLFVVNSDSEVTDHYRDLLGDVFEIRDEYVKADAISVFVQALCHDFDRSQT